MAGESWIVDPLNLRMRLQPFGQELSILAVGTHAQAQRLQAFEENPGVERAHARPGGAQETEHFLAYPFGISNHGSADTAALSVEILGRRVDHQIGTQRQRTL